MLPHMLSTLGPKLAVGDVNKDGIEDVFIGGAKGSAGGIYLQTRSGGLLSPIKLTYIPMPFLRIWEPYFSMQMGIGIWIST